MALPDPVVKVFVTRFAVDDLVALNPDIRRRAAKKLLLIERSPEVGEPLGGNLTGFRKVILGNRDWRIIFRHADGATTAEIWAVIARADDECYSEAQRRLEAAGDDDPDMVALRDVVKTLMARRKRLDL